MIFGEISFNSNHMNTPQSIKPTRLHTNVGTQKIPAFSLLANKIHVIAQPKTTQKFAAMNINQVGFLSNSVLSLPIGIIGIL